MTTNKYEDTYYCVNDARRTVKHVDIVVDFLKTTTKEMTCKEIGQAIFGNGYGTHGRCECNPQELSSILSHLQDGRFVESRKIDGEPFTYEVFEWPLLDAKGRPRSIRVHDDEGNTYEIDNPKYVPSASMVKITKTYTPKVLAYKWVG